MASVRDGFIGVKVHCPRTWSETPPPMTKVIVLFHFLTDAGGLTEALMGRLVVSPVVILSLILLPYKYLVMDYG